MKIGGIILVILGLLCLPHGLIFIVPGVILFLLSQKRKQAATPATSQPPVVPVAVPKIARPFLRSRSRPICPAPLARPLGPGMFRSTGRMVRTCEWTGRCSRIS